MTATEFYQHIHGDIAPFLSKEAVISLLEAFANHRFEQFRNQKEVFNTEQWVNVSEQRKKFKKNP